MKPHALNVHDRVTGRAIPRLSRRASGWWDWFINDALGCSIEGVGGFEKSKTKAHKLASHAAQEYNDRIRRERPTSAPQPKERPYCVPAGDGTEVFRR
jgi:hypothetical protein